MPYVLEVYDSSDAKVAILDSAECEVKIKRVINGQWSITVNYPVPLKDSALNKITYFTADGAKVKIVDTDDAMDYHIFYVSDTEEVDNPDGTVSLMVTGEHESIEDLSKEIITDTLDFQEQPPTVILTKLLTYSTTYSDGTIEPTAPVSIYVSYESVLSAIQKLIEACGGEYDIDAVNSEVDLLDALGSTTKYIHVKKGRNLKSLRRTRYAGDEISKLYGVGGGDPPVTMAGTRHIVSSIDGQNLLATHAKLVPEDDIWNTDYQVEFDTGAEKGNTFVISDCQNLTVEDILTLTGDISAVAAGDKFHLEDTSDNEIDFIDSTPLSTAKEGVYKNTVYRDVINEIVTADFTGTYDGGGLCENWTNEGAATLAENTDTDYITYGTKSQKVTVDAGADKGVSQTFDTDSDKMYRVIVWVFITSGDVKVQVGDYVTAIKNGTDYPGWQKFDFKGKNTKRSLKIQILGDENSGNSVFYVDSILVTEDRQESLSFTPNHDLLELWFEVYDKIIDRQGIQIEYRCTFIDLQKMMPTEYIFEEITLGDSVIISDEELNISEITSRITEINYMPFRPEHTQFTVTSTESQGL